MTMLNQAMNRVYAALLRTYDTGRIVLPSSMNAALPGIFAIYAAQFSAGDLHSKPPGRIESPAGCDGKYER